jgi:hypothetical protein
MIKRQYNDQSKQHPIESVKVSRFASLKNLQKGINRQKDCGEYNCWPVEGIQLSGTFYGCNQKKRQGKRKLAGLQ